MACRLIQMLKYCCICWVKFIYNSANTLKQCNWTNTHTYANQPNQTRELETKLKRQRQRNAKTWQTCDERDNKNLENPKLGKNPANKNGELNQIEWQWKRLFATTTLSLCNLDFDAIHIHNDNDGTHWTALLSQVLLVRYNTVEASVLCNCIFLAQYPSLYFRFNCHGHWTKAHVSTRTHTHTEQ